MWPGSFEQYYLFDYCAVVRRPLIDPSSSMTVSQTDPSDFS